MTLYVIAPTRKAFEQWSGKQDPNWPLPDAVFVHSIKQLTSKTGPEDFLFLNGWQTRPDWRQLYNRALAIGRRP